MIEKQTSYSRIEALESGHVQLRLTTKIVEDGVVISESHHRSVIDLDSDISSLPQSVQDICNAHWTAELRAEWEAKKVVAEEEPAEPVAE
jgi:phage host-nuclease inhibitor protein Gam